MPAEKKDEKLSLKNYTSILPKEQQKLAQKNAVRECDETPKNTFVAYVDEGDDTYDVSLTFSAAGEVLKDSCDCKYSTTFCRHKTALLVHVAGNKKVKQTIAAKKIKLSKGGALLADIGFDELKTWVSELFAANKDIELGFVLRFESAKREYTPEEVVKLTEDAAKIVVKNKKNIDQTQLKKVIDLWKTTHQPVMEQYHAHVTEKPFFLLFQALLECCKKFDAGIHLNSNKVSKYIESLMLSSVEPVNRLEKDESYLLATSHFIRNIVIGHANTVNTNYLIHLRNIADIAIQERKIKLVRSIQAHYSQLKISSIYNGASYTNFLFALMNECGFPGSDFTIFSPIHFDNDFNEKLINLLIENKRYSEAETFCNEQIKGNFRDEYNVPYYNLLKTIYAHTGNEKELIRIKMLLLSFTFSFEDFLYIYNSMTDGDEKKSWRTKLLSKIKNAANNGNAEAQKFYFELYDHEKSYSKMIGFIGNYTKYSFIHQYFEAMARADKTKLLQALINKGDGSFWSILSTNNEEAWYPEILEGLKKHFTKTELLSTITRDESKRVFFRLNGLIEFIKKGLKTTV